MISSATPDLNRGTTPETPDHEVASRCAAAEAEVKVLREMVAEVRSARDDWKSQAEEWKTQAARLMLALPAPRPAPQGLDQKPGPDQRRSRWRRAFGRAG
jgi:hypothetical protein